MRTTIDVPEDLMEEARRVLGFKSKTDTHLTDVACISLPWLPWNALEVVHGIVQDAPQAAAEAFQILGETNLADPNPSNFIKIWLYSHPPLNERLVFAREYDPWSKGQPPRFVK